MPDPRAARGMVNQAFEGHISPVAPSLLAGSFISSYEFAELIFVSGLFVRDFAKIKIIPAKIMSSKIYLFRLNIR